MQLMLAYTMLLVWPAIAVALFRSLNLERAVIWSILGAYMLLPPLVAYDFPLIPPLDKFAIANLTSYILCITLAGQRVPLLPRSLVARLLIILMFLCPVLTVMTNSDPLVYPQRVVPGLSIHETLGALIAEFIEILPFLIGRSLLSSDRAMRDIMSTLVVAGLIYSVPMFIEIRMSPQINVWVYGFFQHDFIQMVRYGGYRPMVFLPHGLWAAFFALMAFVAATAMWRYGEAQRRALYMLATGYLGVLLVMCKSAAALIYGIILLPVVRLLSLRQQLLIAATLAMIAALYPALRGAGLVPIDEIMAQAEAISPDRAASLLFRLNNEDALLARATERPWFGWGYWGRNQIHDPVTGEVTSTTDGRWIIVIGMMGWAGYLAEFGLLSFSIVLLWRTSLRRGVEVSPFAGPVALILGFNMVDMLPNATLIPFTWLLAGALLGYAERLRAGQAVAEVVRVPLGAEPALPVRPRTIL